MPLPKTLRNFNLQINGVGFLGKVDEVTLPELKIKQEDYRAGGMDGAIGVDMGMEKMELSAKLGEHSAAVYGAFGLQDSGAIRCVFRGALVDNNSVTPMVITCNGSVYHIPGNSVKAGEHNSMEFKMSLTYLKIQVGGGDAVEIDVPNMIRRVGGADAVAAIRNVITF